MFKKILYPISAGIIVLGVIYALYVANYTPVPTLSEADVQRDAQIAADTLLMQQITDARRVRERSDTLQRDYTSEIAMLDELATRNTAGNDEQRDLYVRAKLSKAILLQQTNLDYTTDTSRNNFIASYHEMLDIFTSAEATPDEKRNALSQILIGIQQSCECYDWFAAAAETYDNGEFLKKYTLDDFMVTNDTQWRNDRYLGVYMLPFTVKPLTDADVLWQNGHFKALSVLHAMMQELPETDPYLVAWDMEYLIHNLDRTDLSDGARARILGEIDTLYPYLDGRTLLFRETRYHALLLKGYQTALKYSLSVYLPEKYSFDAEAGLQTINDALATAGGIVARGDGDIVYQESITGFLQLYYAYLADATGVHRERIPEMLARFDTPEALRVSQGLYLFFTLPHWQDALRSFVLTYAEGSLSTRTTLEGMGWSFSK